MDKELQKANRYMSQLYNIEEYDNLDFSSELNAEKLLKAKIYFIGKMEEYGNLLAEAKRDVEMKHLFYKMKFAEAKDKWCNTKDENTGKYYTSTRAEDKATFDNEYILAKENYAKAVGDEAYYNANYYNIKEKIHALSQHIGILRSEAETNQFIKENGSNSKT